jgi:transcriptional regulator with XRE-family HTH domain
MDVGSRIAGWRAFRDMSQKELAAAAGVTVAAVYQWESGATSPSLATLAAIVKALKITMAQFWGDVPKSKRAS